MNIYISELVYIGVLFLGMFITVLLYESDGYVIWEAFKSVLLLYVIVATVTLLITFVTLYLIHGQ